MVIAVSFWDCCTFGEGAQKWGSLLLHGVPLGCSMQGLLATPPRVPCIFWGGGWAPCSS